MTINICDGMTNYNYDNTYWVYEGVTTFFEQIKNDEF